MALSNAEKQARWRLKHPELAKQRVREFMHNARVEGRISRNGIKYEASEFLQFKGKYNFKRIQIEGEKWYRSEGNSRLQEQLKAIGVEVSRWRTGKEHLEKKHTCTELCYFYGHSETWVDIEPVVYKLHFHSGADFGGFKDAYWVFKRYLVLERRLDFPEPKPEFVCSDCGLQQLKHLDDIFVFQHKCPPKFDALAEAKKLLGRN